ncbi:MAG TPA: hypothetical protein VJJ55_01495 [Candidatus Paceibacterota bacterium]
MEEIKQTTERSIVPKWIHPDLSHEKGEIERVIEEFLGRDLNEKAVQEIVAELESAPIVELSDELWAKLENTDSWKIEPGDIEEVRAITQKYNQELSPENKRSLENTLEGFRQGREMQVPVIVRDKNGTLHLLNGNTRLMIARALKIRPHVIVAETI